jgi:hypothetical protein
VGFGSPALGSFFSHLHRYLCRQVLEGLPCTSPQLPPPGPTVSALHPKFQLPQPPQTPVCFSAHLALFGFPSWPAAWKLLWAVGIASLISLSSGLIVLHYLLCKIEKCCFISLSCFLLVYGGRADPRSSINPSWAAAEVLSFLITVQFDILLSHSIVTLKI